MRKTAYLLMLLALSPLPAGAAPAGARLCAVPRTGFVACHAVARDANATSSPAGYGPADFTSAYKLPGTGGAGQTVAIVDAYDNPAAEADLKTYRAFYRLPPCTTANGCFRKIDQRGGRSYPAFDEGWAMEIALDLDAVTAICPACHILLVEASSPSIANMLAAEDQAIAQHATVVSNSWGGPESSVRYDQHFDHPGIPIAFSAGDSGYGVEYPASSPFVTAVGGTHLARSTNSRGWTESAWSGSGSGCSAYAAQPSWQHANANISAACGNRAVADVAADADPATGAAVYSTAGYQGRKGWFVMGGTSLAAPIVAGVYALAGNATATRYGSYLYAHATGLYAVTSGRNGTCGTALCQARSGWDGPTGLGTPRGTAAF